MKFKNIIATSILTFILVSSCKPTTPTTVPDGGGGVGGTTSSTSTVSTTSSGPLGGPCTEECPEVLPTTGDACDALADQYCEYAGGICKFANCNSSTAVWEVGDLNPCICYPGSGHPVMDAKKLLK